MNEVVPGRVARATEAATRPGVRAIGGIGPTQRRRASSAARANQARHP